MLVAELAAQPIGAGFAFRKAPSPACKTATLPNVAVRPPYRELGLERRLIQQIEEGAASLGITGIMLAARAAPNGSSS